MKVRSAGSGKDCGYMHKGYGSRLQMHAAGAGLGCKIEFQALPVGHGCRPERQPWGQVLESWVLQCSLTQFTLIPLAVHCIVELSELPMCVFSRTWWREIIRCIAELPSLLESFPHTVLASSSPPCWTAGTVAHICTQLHVKRREER